MRINYFTVTEIVILVRVTVGTNAFEATGVAAEHTRLSATPNVCWNW